VTVHAATDATVFMAAVATLVDADPVGCSVLATNAVRAMADPEAFPDPYWMWVEEPDGVTVAAAMHTPPWTPHLVAQDPSAGVVLADHLAASGRAVAGVGGLRPVAEAFAGRWAELRPCRVRTTRDAVVYEATAVPVIDRL